MTIRPSATQHSSRIDLPQRAVFLDRDGVLNHDAGYVSDPKDLALLPGVSEALRILSQKGFCLVVVTNQSGVARGKFDLDAVERFHAAMREKLTQLGAPVIDGWYVCPHLPDATVEAWRKNCDCRKPKPGMLRAAAKDLGLDLAKSWIVGDKDADISCGINAGLKGAIQVTGDTGYTVHAKASWSCETLLEAAHWLVSQD
jgi:D-glycero-D-manno-heptose 1,7-bisphosphate phosphatase